MASLHSTRDMDEHADLMSKVGPTVRSIAPSGGESCLTFLFPACTVRARLLPGPFTWF